MRGIFVLSITALVGCGSGGGVMTSSAVELQNATAHLTSQYPCAAPSGASGQCLDYQITLSVANGARQGIDRVQDVQLAMGDQPLKNANAVQCDGPPWTLGSGAMSSVITLNVTLGASPKLNVECDNGDGVSTALTQAPSTPADAFDVRVLGLLSDAQPFEADTTAMIR